MLKDKSSATREGKLATVTGPQAPSTLAGLTSKLDGALHSFSAQLDEIVTQLKQYEVQSHDIKENDRVSTPDGREGYVVYVHNSTHNDKPYWVLIPYPTYSKQEWFTKDELTFRSRKSE